MGDGRLEEDQAFCKLPWLLIPALALLGLLSPFSPDSLNEWALPTPSSGFPEEAERSLERGSQQPACLTP